MLLPLRVFLHKKVAVIHDEFFIIIAFRSLSSQSINSIKKWANMSNSSVDPQMLSCLMNRDSFVAYTVFLLGYFILPLPLVALVLHVIIQRWRSAMVTATCHMDLFTYHMVLLELLAVAGGCVYYYCSITGNTQQWTAILSFIGVDQCLFHLLACLDRYLAVAHPIRYMWTRQSAGIHLRNFAIGCAWLLGMPACVMGDNRRIYSFSFQFSSLLFSSGTLCALFAISQSGPKRESRDKQRALHAVAAITATLALRFLGNLIPVILQATVSLSLRQHCLVMTASLPTSLPTSLVMPLLFLQRAGKLPNCQNTSKSEKA